MILFWICSLLNFYLSTFVKKDLNPVGFLNPCSLSKNIAAQIAQIYKGVSLFKKIC